MLKRNWPILLGPPLVLMAVALAVGRSDQPVIAGKATAVQDLVPCADVTATATGRPAPGTWWKTTDTIDASGVLVGRQLFVGHGPTATAKLDLPVESAVSGPVDGIVAIASDDGTQSQVRLVSVAVRCALVIDQRDDVVRSALIDPHDGSVLAHVVARGTRVDLGTYRISPSSSSSGASTARLVVPPLGTLAGEVGSVWATVLRLDAAGAQLAVQSCADIGCLTRVFDLTSPGAAPTILRGIDQGPLLGFAGADLVTWQACVAYPCQVLAWNTSTGRSRILVTNAQAAALTDNGRRLVVLAADATGARPTAVDTATGRATSLRGIPEGSWPIGDGPAATLGLEVAADEIAFATPGGDPIALRPDSAAQEALP